MGNKTILEQAEKVRQDRVRDVDELEKEGRETQLPTERKGKNSQEIQELVAARIN
jgi:hypothetical protein